VVNNSGRHEPHAGRRGYYNYANAQNCVVVASAGNEGASVEDAFHIFEYLYPAAYDHVLSVAAVDSRGNITDFSDYNLALMSVHRVWIYSAQFRASIRRMAHSQAGPNAAGVIALIRQKFLTLPPIRHSKTSCNYRFAHTGSE